MLCSNKLVARGKPSRHLLGLRGTPKERLSYGQQKVQGRAEKKIQSGPFKTKNAQTLPKQLWNNFEKVEQTTFLNPKMVKNEPSKPQKWANFWQKISIFGVIYWPLEMKIHTKVGLLRSKKMPKHFLNSSKTSLKKSRKRLFWPQNGQKWPLKSAKTSKILTQNLIFPGHL